MKTFVSTFAVLAVACSQALAGGLLDVRAGAADGRARIDVECSGYCAGIAGGGVVLVRGLYVSSEMRAAQGPAPFVISPHADGALVRIEGLSDIAVRTIEGDSSTIVRIVGRFAAAEQSAAAEPQPSRAVRPTPASAVASAPATRPAPAAPAIGATTGLRESTTVLAGTPGELFRAAVASHPSPDLSNRSCDMARARLGADGWAIDALVHVAYCDAADGKEREALEAFERVLVYDPQHLMALYGRAAIAAIRGDQDVARRWYDGARAAEMALAEGRS